MIFSIYRIRAGQSERKYVSSHATKEGAAMTVALLSVESPADLFIICDGEVEICRVRNGNVWERKVSTAGGE